MDRLRAAGLLAIAATVAPAAIARKPARPAPSPLFVLESPLPPGEIVACLSKRAVQPTVLPRTNDERVLLGPGNGWIDLRAAPGGSWLRARILWGSPAMTELWVRGCAAGMAPRRGSSDAEIAGRVPVKLGLQANPHPG